MIGIVILNYQNYKVTERCVQSIVDNPPSEDYKIYIVDNGSNNESFNVLSKKYNVESIVVHRIDNNLGFAAGNDVGITLCEKDNIIECVLSNSDILFNRGSIDGIINTLRKKDKAVIVGPKIINGGTEQRLMHSSRLKKGRLIDPLELGRFFPVKKLDEENEIGVHKVWSVSGCCFGINIEKFRKMGGFDTNTFLYNEENIMGMQAENTKLSTYINLDVSVVHEHGASSGKDNDFVRTEYIKSTLYYWKQYRSARRLILFAILRAYIIKLRLQRNADINPTLIYKNGIDYIKQLNGR